MSDYNLGTASGRIVVDGDGAAKGFQVAQKAAAAFGDAVKKAISDKINDVQKLGDRLTKVGIAGSIGLAGAIKTAASFEAQMSAIKAVSGATADQMNSVSEAALRIGKDTTFSASEAGQAMEELVKAGVSLPDVLNGAADATVALAAAGGVALPEAATIAANAMNQFGLTAKQMPRVADLIAGAANASAIDVSQFGQSIQQVGAVAHLAGVSFDDTAVAIAEMGNAGIKASDAGTSLKTFFQNLIPQTSEQIDLFQKLGLLAVDTGKGFQNLAAKGIQPTGKSLDSVITSIEQYNHAFGGAKVGTDAARTEAIKTGQTLGVLKNQFFDASGSAKDMAQMADVLGGALKGMTKEQKLATLGTLFGSDAIRAAAVIADNGSKGFNSLAASMNKVKATDVAATRLDNFNGSLEQLKGSLETAAITIGRVFLPVATTIVNAISGVIDIFNALPGPIKTFIAVIIGGGSAMSLFVGLAIKAAFVLGPLLAKMLLFRGIKLIAGSILAFGRALFTTGSLSTAGAAGLARYQAAVAKVKLAIAGLGAGAILGIGLAVSQIAVQIAQSMQKAAPSVDQMTASLLKLKTASDISNLDKQFSNGERVKGFGDALKAALDPKILDKLDNWAAKIVSFGQMTGNATDYAKKAFGSLDESLAQLVQGGNIDTAKQKFDLIAQAAQAQGYTLDQVKGLFPQYADSLTNIQNSATLAASGHSKLADAVGTANGAMTAAKSAADALKDAIDGLNGNAISTARAEIALKDGLDTVRKAFKGANDSISTNNKVGREHLGVVLDQIGKANEYAQAIANQTGSVNRGRAAFQAQIGTLRSVLSAAGLTKGQIDKLISTYGRVPKKVTTELTAQDYASRAIDAVKGNLNSLHDKTVTILSKYVTVGSTAPPPLLRPTKKAAGGIIKGPGSATSDSIPAMLSNGEFVVNAAATKKFRALLEAINSGKLKVQQAAGSTTASVASAMNTLTRASNTSIKAIALFTAASNSSAKKVSVSAKTMSESVSRSHASTAKQREAAAKREAAAEKKRIAAYSATQKRVKSLEEQFQKTMGAIYKKGAASYTDYYNISHLDEKLKDAKAPDGLVKSVRKSTDQITKLVKKRDAVVNKLKAAQQKLNEAMQIRNQFAGQVRDSAVSYASLLQSKVADAGSAIVKAAQAGYDQQKSQLDAAKSQLDSAGAAVEEAGRKYGKNSGQYLGAQLAYAKAQKEVARQTAATATAQTNLNNAGTLNADQINKDMQARLAKIKHFNATLAKLRKMGLNSTTYKQIVEAGVDDGTAYADALAEGGKSGVGKINKTQSDINKAASSLGNTTADQLYKSGYAAAQGLVNGLKKQQKAIERQMDKIADAMVARIKKALKIHSPSRVMEEISVYSALGLIKGAKNMTPKIAAAWDGATKAYAATKGPDLTLGTLPAANLRHLTRPTAQVAPAQVTNVRQGDTFNLSTLNGPSAREIFNELNWQARTKGAA